jgi:hypothetical protein
MFELALCTHIVGSWSASIWYQQNIKQLWNFWNDVRCHPHCFQESVWFLQYLHSAPLQLMWILFFFLTVTCYGIPAGVLDSNCSDILHITSCNLCTVFVHIVLLSCLPFMQHCWSWFWVMSSCASEQRCHCLRGRGDSSSGWKWLGWGCSQVTKVEWESMVTY